MNTHVERARQIADALESQDVERKLHEQFVAEWKAWEAEDPTRTMAAFDREIGRGKDYTGRIVRFVTGAAPRGTPFADGQAERAARKTLREQPQAVAKEIAEAMENPVVREQVYSHMDDKTEQEREQRREQRRAVREEQHENPNAALVRLIAADLHRADLTLRRAVDTAREASPWSDKDRQWLQAHVNRTAGWLDMLRLAIEQATDVDWDTALAELTAEER